MKSAEVITATVLHRHLLGIKRAIGCIGICDLTHFIHHWSIIGKVSLTSSQGHMCRYVISSAASTVCSGMSLRSPRATRQLLFTSDQMLLLNFRTPPPGAVADMDYFEVSVFVANEFGLFSAKKFEAQAAPVQLDFEPRGGCAWLRAASVCA
jgi:hypothetical protein